MGWSMNPGIPGATDTDLATEETLELVRQAINQTALKPVVDYDYLDVQQTDSDTETYIYKNGGSGGATIRTIVVNYTSSAKTDIDNVSWS